MDFVFESRIANYIAAAQVLFEHKGLLKYANVLRYGKYQLKTKTGYDNWDGGQYAHTLLLTVPMNVFECIADDLSACEQAIMNEINVVSNEVKNESIESVGVSPEMGVVMLDGLDRIRAGSKIQSAFDEYEIVEKVGQGGNGRVFSARDSSGKFVAIKFLESDRTDKRKRFKNEICFCEQCKHPNIVKILDRGCVNVGGLARTFYVMPLYAESLRDRIGRGISPDEAVAVFVGLLHALREAHSQGVIHRDVKPENIMFAKDGKNPILCDFGIAHLPQELKATMVVTKDSDRMANFRYAAPGQKDGKNNEVGPQADLYALGLILNEMFTRQVPAAEGYKRIGSIVPEYGFLDDVFSQLFQQDPSKRPYPEGKILSDLKARMEICRNEQTASLLREVREVDREPVAPDMFVTRRYYKSPNLLFEFNERIPMEWQEILIRGSYNHVSVWGYDTARVSRFNENTLAIPLDCHEDESTIKQIIDNFSDWVLIVNVLYKETLASLASERLAREVAERKAELARLENETRIQRLLSNE